MAQSDRGRDGCPEVPVSRCCGIRGPLARPRCDGHLSSGLGRSVYHTGARGGGHSSDHQAGIGRMPWGGRGPRATRREEEPATQVTRNRAGATDPAVYSDELRPGRENKREWTGRDSRRTVASRATGSESIPWSVPLIRTVRPALPPHAVSPRPPPSTDRHADQLRHRDSAGRAPVRLHRHPHRQPRSRYPRLTRRSRSRFKVSTFSPCA